MNLTPSFIRKVLYLAAMIPPLVVIVYVGMPTVGNEEDGGKKPGGKLAQLRDQHDLSQANLGKIDPASETMKLSTLGLRGVAAQMLWLQAYRYKARMNFDGLSATLNQLIKLQPNFVKVWEFQAHNLSYNVSVEFDDYRDRYNWVTKGINFLMSGTTYNRKEPKLMSQCGWFISHKIGRSDEHKQFRRLFRTDTEFHDSINDYVEVDDGKSRVDLKPDNWLVGRLWYNKAERLIASIGPQIRESHWLFYSHGPKCLISFASALDQDDTLPPDEVSQQAWLEALREWVKYGQQEFFGGGKRPVQLDSRDDLRRRLKELELEIDAVAAGLSENEIKEMHKFLDDFAGDDTPVEELRDLISESLFDLKKVREEIKQEKRDALPLPHRTALGLPDGDRTQAQQKLAIEARSRIEPVLEDVVDKAPSGSAERMRELYAEFQMKFEDLDSVETLEGHSKYQYWKVRCQVEATDEARAAKRHLFNARRLVEQGALEKKEVTQPGSDMLVTVNGAKEEFEAAWDQWHAIFSKNPKMYDNVNESQMLLNDIMAYDRVLSQLDEPPLPYDFKLRELIELEAGLWEGRPIGLKPEDKEEEKEKAPPETEPATTPPTENPGKKANAPAADKKPPQQPADAPNSKPADDKTDDPDSAGAADTPAKKEASPNDGPAS